MKLYLKLSLFALLVLGTSVYSQPKTYFVAVGGSDLSAGTFDSPFATVKQAVLAVVAGDTIYLRGGTYIVSAYISLSKAGAEGKYFNLFAYKNEKPVFNFSAETSSDGFKVSGGYWHLKGIESSYAYHNGISISSSHNIIENCSVHDNRNSGMQLGSGASYNKIINCDSYYNYDAPNGGNADGFSPKLDVGTGNYFYGCRSWQNSDDGFDCYLRPSNNINTVFENCWSFMNGYLKDGTQITTGNGNGFKMGGSDDKTLRHNVILRNCVAFDNRVKGFDQNNNKGSMTLYNCTGFRNGTYNFSIPGAIDTSSTATIENCISYLSQGVTLISGVTTAADTWINPFTVSAADFASLDTTGVRGPRKDDGSLPDVSFLHLAPASALIDAGVVVGLPFSGSAPDLGAFEYGMAMPPVKIEKVIGLPSGFVLHQNYPNPFNPSTTINYSLPRSEKVMIKVYDLLGREITTLVNDEMPAGTHSVKFNAINIPSGVYIYRITTESFSEARKMIYLK